MLAPEASSRTMFHNNDRQTTPPSLNAHMYFPNSAESHNTNISVFTSAGNSPESVLTDITAPSRGGSPGASHTLRHQGPLLLPKIRCQDQTAEPIAGPVRHHRSVSAAHHPSFQYTPYAHPFPHPPISRPRTRSPDGRDLNSPASATFTPVSAASTSLSPLSAITSATSYSATSGLPSAITPTSALAAQVYNSACDSGFNSGLTSPIAFSNPQDSRRSSLAHVRTSSLPAGPGHGHSRSASASSVDEATIWRHGYPTQYRQIPQYITSAPTMGSTPAMVAPPMQMSHSAGSSFMAIDPTLSYDEELPFSFPQETTSLISYLSAQNPSPNLILRSVNPDYHKKTRDWWWWDVRTLRSWSDFNLNTILSHPDFPQLLHVPRDAANLPHPSRSSPSPETEHHLRTVYSNFFAVRINAALKATLGDHHLFMHAVNSASNNPWPKPDFISNYPSDCMHTHRGEIRGRLVGLVKPYQHWNTAMRSGDQSKQVHYLHGLSHLHRVMREHGCRYGFIITEIELLCVRMGAKDGEYKPSLQPNIPDEGPVPWFGYLETAPPIQLSTCGQEPNTNAPQLTAPLALWYLHMLAKEDPLRGQANWKIGVGGPAARTRQFCLERDSWMPKAQDSEKRNAKNCRGWVWPEDAYNKKENPKSNRRR